MILSLFLILYTITLSLLLPLVAPFWLKKMIQRGGWQSGLKQRLGIYDIAQLKLYCKSDYYHAVSVGEVIMAIKVISHIQKTNPEYKAVIAVTTATAHKFVQEKQLTNCLLCYAPVDLPFCLNQIFSHVSPRKVILVDSELWPNLLHYCKNKNLPVNIINGRLSERSYHRFIRFKHIFSRLLEVVDGACLDGETQIKRWSSLGLHDSKLYSVGSLKFDLTQTNDDIPKDFEKQLSYLYGKGPVILISSSHNNEELALASELKKLAKPFRLIIVPRHAERRSDIKRDLESLGFNVLVRTKFTPPKKKSSNNVLLADTTGELKQWMQLADFVVVGKSWLAKGGQNPFESVILGKVTICGPYMANFEPLFSELTERNGAIQLNQVSQLSHMIQSLLKEPRRRKQISQRGRNFLMTKIGAVEKTSTIILNH